MNNIERILHETHNKPVERLKRLRAYWLSSCYTIKDAEREALRFAIMKAREDVDDTTRSC